MRIAISGGTGFIGGHLIAHFKKRGDELILISRSASGHAYAGVQTVTWSEIEHNPRYLEGTDAWINLAGSTINQRWSETAKRQILSSRLKTTAAVASTLKALQNKPPVVVNASAMAIYGTSETHTYDEFSPVRADDFLAEVVKEWEEAADRIPAERIVKIRTGLVLGTDGGAFPKMALPFKFGAGGRIGSGSQWMSWIHIADMVALIDACIRNEDISGPVNATAPHPVRNREFAQTLGSVLRRPHVLPVPAFALKLVLGELSMLLLEGQRVLPRKLLEHEFQFRYPTLEEALLELTGAERPA
ncbi:MULTISPECIES: TIGR01777 family oxidoreductase [unclassified Paenibacillus]|uniref:TIGR01777 family oxidoreductase n=1 Tax=unclassified Paenibacillus TaxID=185978 RepID=UPI00020D7CA1|nr:MULTISPECIES: TIGR01777 family oxidoreductase [unclassified Paenibacillus]EGL14809.1 TIGR01777 family protein [Paenibacillus sp. HGF7]EPD82350.1 TIGR01777 family protein [Paenibacillus sp. HGH0039]